MNTNGCQDSSAKLQTLQVVSEGASDTTCSVSWHLCQLLGNRFSKELTRYPRQPSHVCAIEFLMRRAGCCCGLCKPLMYQHLRRLLTYGCTLLRCLQCIFKLWVGCLLKPQENSIRMLLGGPSIHSSRNQAQDRICALAPHVHGLPHA